MKPLTYASIIALVAIGIRCIPSVTVTVPFGQGPPHEAPGSEQARTWTAPVEVPDRSKAPLAEASDEHGTLPLHLAGIEVLEDPKARTVGALTDGQGAPPEEAWAALIPHR